MRVSTYKCSPMEMTCARSRMTTAPRREGRTTSITSARRHVAGETNREVSDAQQLNGSLLCAGGRSAISLSVDVRLARSLAVPDLTQ